MVATSGAVRLAGADITGSVNCHGAQLTGCNSDGDALVADQLMASGDVFLSEGFTADGTISLCSARVGGRVDLVPQALAGGDAAALKAAGARISGTLTWMPVQQVCGQVDLADASVGELVDDWSGARHNGYWPDPARLRLDGFTYGRFGGSQQEQATVKQRLAWIRSQYKPKPTVLWVDTLSPPVVLPALDGAEYFATQPYEQLALTYRQAGQDTEARRVAIARRADLRTHGNLNPYREFGNWLLDKSIKYGYQTWRAGVGLALVFGAFLLLTFLAQRHHLMAPVGNIDGLQFVPSATRCTSSYPCFYPFGYAIDTVIPLINVHQAAYWGPDGHAAWGRAWVISTWIATGLGWALATLLVAGYTGLVRRD